MKVDFTLKIQVPVLQPQTPVQQLQIPVQLTKSRVNQVCGMHYVDAGVLSL